MDIKIITQSLLSFITRTTRPFCTRKPSKRNIQLDPQNISSRFYETHSFNDLLQLYKENHQTMNTFSYTNFLNKAITLTKNNGRLPKKEVEETLRYLLSQLNTLRKEEFISFLNCLCLKTFPLKMLKKQEKGKIFQIIVSKYEDLMVKQKSFGLKYINQYLKGLEEKSQIQRNKNKIADLLSSEHFLQMLQDEKNPLDFTYYLRDYINFALFADLDKQQTAQKSQVIIDFIYKKLENLSCRGVFLFVQTLSLQFWNKQMINKQLILENVNQKLQKELEKNYHPQNYLYLIKILVKIKSEESTKIGMKIFNKLKQQTKIIEDGDMENKILNKFSIYEVNLAIQNMVLLNCIDEQLFFMFNNTFLHLFSETTVNDIQYFIRHRNKIMKLILNNVREKPSKITSIKKEHIIFTNKIIQLMKGNVMPFEKVVMIIQECQQFPVKSRLLKRELKQVLEKYSTNTEEQVTLFDAVLNNY